MADLRLAYLILAHNDATHLERLCHKLSGHSVFIHVDAKAAHFPVDHLASLPGVTLVPRGAVHWGDFSMIEATLTLLRVAREQGPFDRFVLLSGSCYPIEPTSTLLTRFATEPLREWIALTPITESSSLAKLIGRRWRMAPVLRNAALDRQARAMWSRVSGILGRDLAREIGMTPHFGNQFWALSDSCIGMILEFVRTHPAFVAAYRSVYAPDEHFFHTIVGNSDFGKHAMAVPDRGSATNHGAPLHMISPSSERYFTDADSMTSFAASGSSFIRKVSTERSKRLLDEIDAELLGLKRTAA